MTPGAVGAALEASAGEGVRPPKAATSRPTTSQHVGDEPATRHETRIGSIIPTHRDQATVNDTECQPVAPSGMTPAFSDV
jgi:hypothetical protein